MDSESNSAFDELDQDRTQGRRRRNPSGNSSTKSSEFFQPSMKQLLNRKYQITPLSTGKEAWKVPTEVFEELSHFSRFSSEDAKLQQTLHKELSSKPATAEVNSMRELAKMASTKDDIELNSQVELPPDASKMAAVSDIENPIPSLLINPYNALPSVHSNSIKVLQEFSDEWGIKPDYDIKVIRNGTGPTTFAVSVLVGIRKGDGKGATVSEAKAEAAATCLGDLVPYLPIEHRLAYKPVVKTDPAKDILYILNGICEDYKFKKPTYEFKELQSKTYQCVATLCEISAQGEASKKRVAIRIAAIDLFQKLRKLYNSGKIPETTFQ